MRHHRIGKVISVAAQIQQGLTADTKAGINCAVGIQPHHPVVERTTVDAGGLGIGKPGDQNLAVILDDDRPGVISAIGAQIDQGLANGQPRTRRLIELLQLQACTCSGATEGAAASIKFLAVLHQIAIGRGAARVVPFAGTSTPAV